MTAINKMKNGVSPCATHDEDGFLCLKGDLLWKWRAFDAELRAATIELEALKNNIAREISKHPEVERLMGMQVALIGSLGTAKSSLSSLLSEIESIFGVSLKDCAIDDKTGRLYIVSEDSLHKRPIKARSKNRAGIGTIKAKVNKNGTT